MLNLNAYALIIACSVIVIISYFYGLIARKTNIPSVLMLLVTGILIHLVLKYMGIPGIDLLPVLEVFGIVGLIMIVLEASLDLELNHEKRPLILNSFFISILSLLIGTFAVALIFISIWHIDLVNAMLYAIPLSIMSSAIVIPSVNNIHKSKKEFLIYESTLSDILGIMFFYLLIQSFEADSVGEIALSVLTNILLTLAVSVVASYGLIYIFHKLENSIRLFLLIAVLILLYALGKLFHLSSLLIILAFGLVLNNRKLFLLGRFKRYMNDEALDKVYDQLKLVTIESSFIVRTFFFVIFGMTILFHSLIDVNVLIISILLIAVLYGIRWIILKVFLRRAFTLELLTAPRGLITILLFFSIPDEFKVAEFDNGILLFLIIISSILMTIGLVKYGKRQTGGDTFADNNSVN